jgi:hypothetical protein
LKGKHRFIKDNITRYIHSASSDFKKLDTLVARTIAYKDIAWSGVGAVKQPDELRSSDCRHNLRAP